MSMRNVIPYVSNNEFDCLIVQKVVTNAFPDATFLCIQRGQGALQWLTSLPKTDLPLFLVVDYFLPDLDAKQLATQIREVPEFEGLPLILLGEWPVPDSDFNLDALGPVVYLKKSIDLELFQTDLERAMLEFWQRA